MEYRASYDSLTKWISGIVIIFLLGIGLTGFISFSKTSNMLYYQIGIFLLSLLTLIGAWIFSIKSYTLKDNVLTINRPLGNIEISLAEIKEIMLLDKFNMLGTIRTFGSGGLFGYYGKFYIPKLGHVNMFCTQRIHQILIVTMDEKKRIISPDDLGLFEKILVKVKN
ncbi:MAG: PH domain-containing protein [Chitinophagales bacterium]|nr:PH domain-containing protein [Chitinophagales bacterium]